MSDLSIAIESADIALENVLDGATDKPKKRSMRAAINAYCKECTYDDAFKGGGTWREQVEACTVTKCPLHEFRPKSRPRKNNEQDMDDDES